MKHLKIYEEIIKESKENTNKIELTSNLLDICDIGMYNSYLEPDEIFSSWIEDDETSKEEIEHYHDKFDNKKYKKWILENVEEYLTDKIKLPEVLKSINPHIKEIKYEKIWSPKYYNYETDQLYFDLIVEDEFYDFMLEDINSGGRMYDKELKQYKSYPGFISSMPQTTEELENGIKDKDERAVAAWLQIKLNINEDYEPWENDSFEEYIKEDYADPRDFISE